MLVFFLPILVNRALAPAVSDWSTEEAGETGLLPWHSTLVFMEFALEQTWHFLTHVPGGCYEKEGEKECREENE